MRKRATFFLQIKVVQFGFPVFGMKRENNQELSEKRAKIGRTTNVVLPGRECLFSHTGGRNWMPSFCNHFALKDRGMRGSRLWYNIQYILFQPVSTTQAWIRTRVPSMLYMRQLERAEVMLPTDVSIIAADKFLTNSCCCRVASECEQDPPRPRWICSKLNTVISSGKSAIGITSWRWRPPSHPLGILLQSPRYCWDLGISSGLRSRRPGRLRMDTFDDRIKLTGRRWFSRPNAC